MTNVYQLWKRFESEDFVHQQPDKMMKFAFLVLMSSLLSTQAELVSPCPEVLTLTASNAEPSTYDAVLKLKPDYDLKGTWIRVVFDKNPPGLTSRQGEAVPRDDGFLVMNRNASVKTGVPFEVPLSVSFKPDSPMPKIVAVRLNGRTVCPAHPPVSISACPGVFSYDESKNETGKWYGTLNLETEYELSGVWLRIILNNKAEFLNSDFGEVITKEDGSYLLKNADFHIKPQTPVKVPFSVKYSESGPKPEILEVRLNARTVCEKKQ